MRVNRTVISDSSDDGSTFFFHSTSFSNFDSKSNGDEDNDTEDSADDSVEDDEEVPMPDDAKEADQEEDQGENVGANEEVADDDMGGIDDGLLA